MTSPAYIWHVALGAGMGTRETREHLSDAELTRYRAHIERAMASPTGDVIPGHGAYNLTAQSISGVLLGTVGRASDTLTICTFMVVLKSRHATKAWEALHQGYPDFADTIGNVPRAPYCAMRAEFGLMLDASVDKWLDAYQIAVAWAWLERKDIKI